MLVLSRKRDERILIGSDIEMRILSIHGNRVRLGSSCPEDVRILRSEIAPLVNLTSISRYTLEMTGLRMGPSD
jgi:carbon storage regulator